MAATRVDKIFKCLLSTGPVTDSSGIERRNQAIKDSGLILLNVEMLTVCEGDTVNAGQDVGEYRYQ